jgi:hypothetical protein
MGGRVQASARRASDELLISAMGCHLQRALAVGIDSILTLPGHAALMSAEGPNLLVTVFLDQPDGPLPLITFGVATERSPDTDRLWRIVGGSGVPPAIPWCATKEEPYASAHHITLPRVDEYKRCLAWAWLDMQYAGSRGGR